MKTMKKNVRNLRFVQAASAGVLSLGLIAIPFSVSANAQDATSQDGTAIPGVEDVEFDWGWLGLLGLLGLAGLAGRKRDTHHQTDHHADRPVATPTSYQSNVPPSPANPQPDAPRYRDPYRDPRA